MNLTQGIINKSKVEDKEQFLKDHVVPQLFFRIRFERDGGGRSWVIRYDDPISGQKRRLHTLANDGGITLVAAREAARQFLASLAKGENPSEPKKIIKYPSLERAIGLYEPWLTANRRAAASTLSALRTFSSSNLWKKKLDKITRADLNIWRTKILQDGCKKATANRKHAMLQAMINRLVKEEIIAEIHFPKLEKLREDDSKIKTRYIGEDEREEILRTATLLSREYPYLRTAIILSFYSGIRQGTLRQLLWSDYDRQQKTLCLRAEIMKGMETKIIPVNKTISVELERWRREAKGETIISDQEGNPVPKDRLDNHWDRIKRNCGVKWPSWHDMRHSFASSLVKKGVNLFTVKELLCHKDIKITLRYSHLAPNDMSSAVSKLDD